MSPSRRIVAVALLTEAELDMLGKGFDRLFPVDHTPHLLDLLNAIDEADAKLAAQAPTGPVTMIVRSPMGR